MPANLVALEKRAKESIHRDVHTILLFPENNSYVVIDAAPKLTETFSGKVSIHPVDDGGNISDNHVVNNTKLQIEGVISDAGFFGFGGQISSAINNVKSSINDLFGREESLTDRVNRSKAARSFLQLASGVIFSRNVTVVFSHQSYNNCYMTNLVFTRDKDTSDALRFSASLEQIRSANITTTTVNAVKKTSGKTGEDSENDSDSGTKGTLKEEGTSFIKGFVDNVRKSLG